MPTSPWKQSFIISDKQPIVNPNRNDCPHRIFQKYVFISQIAKILRKYSNGTHLHNRELSQRSSDASDCIFVELACIRKFAHFHHFFMSQTSRRMRSVTYLTVPLYLSLFFFFDFQIFSFALLSEKLHRF